MGEAGRKGEKEPNISIHDMTRGGENNGFAPLSGFLICLVSAL